MTLADHRTLQAHARLVVLVAALLAGALALVSAPADTAVVAAATPARDEAAPAGADRARIAPSETRTRAGIPFYGAPAGTWFEYRCRSESASQMRKDGAEDPVAARMQVQGTLHVAVLAVSADEVAFAVCLAQPSVEVGAGAGSAGAALRDDLRRRVRVRMTRDGMVRGYAFPAAFLGEHRNWIRTLVAALRCPVVAGAEAHEVLDDDATGTARVRCRVEHSAGGCTVRRQKLAYVADAPDALLPGVEGVGETRFDAATGWPLASNLRETLCLDLHEVGARVFASFATELERTAEGDGGDVDPAALDGDLSPASGAHEAAAQSGNAERAHYEDLLHGIGVPQLVAEVGELARAGRMDSIEMFDARSKVVWLLRLRPECLADVASVLRSGIEDGCAAVLLSALGAVSTPAAQDLLADCAAPSGGNEALRLGALRALFQVEAPEPTVVAATHAVLADARSSGDLRTTALLLQGAHAAHRADLIGELLGRESEAQAQGVLVDWLEALGNAGAPAVLQPVQRWLAADDAVVRAAAVSALRRVEQAQAVDLLIERAGDAAGMVRARVVAALAGRADARVLPVLVQLLASDGEVPVRLAALDALGKRGGDVAERAIRAAAARDPSPRVRELAGTMLR